MSALFAGIDGGQSSTIATIGDERGRVLGRGTAGACDEVGESAQSAKLADALRSALLDATRNAALPEETRFASIVAAISGYEGHVYGAQPQLPTNLLKIVHDARGAHAAAFGDGAGVVVIAGTGSVVYGRDERGAEVTLGGWGYLFGDEGSAFWIAREALVTMMRLKDSGNPRHHWEERIALDFFGVGSLREITRGFYAGQISRTRIAEYAPIALERGRFRKITETGAITLGRLACRALDGLRLEQVAFVGGLFRDHRYNHAIAAFVMRSRAQTQIVTPKYEPAGGALLLAYKQARVPVRELTT